MPADRTRARPALRDLTHPVVDAMPVYPGDPAVSVAPALSVGADGVAVTRVEMGSHTGTHVDAPSHTVAGGRTLASVGLDELSGDALVVRVPGLADGGCYGWKELSAGGAIPARVPSIVLVDTGWACYFWRHRRVHHPALHPDAAQELMRRGMRVLGVDTLSPDPTGPGADAYPVHEVVLGADGLIVENLCALDDLPTVVRVGIFPLRLAGDGAPVRAVAYLD